MEFMNSFTRFTTSSSVQLNDAGHKHSHPSQHFQSTVTDHASTLIDNTIINDVHFHMVAINDHKNTLVVIAFCINFGGISEYPFVVDIIEEDTCHTATDATSARLVMAMGSVTTMEPCFGAVSISYRHFSCLQMVKD